MMNDFRIENISDGESLVDYLTYMNYAYNRDNGMTKEQLARTGIGRDLNEDMIERYEKAYQYEKLQSNKKDIS